MVSAARPTDSCTVQAPTPTRELVCRSEGVRVLRVGTDSRRRGSEIHDAQVGAAGLPCFVEAIALGILCVAGPVAQWLERGAHNSYVAGSIPAGPTSLTR
jgi:hypothetical protein